MKTSEGRRVIADRIKEQEEREEVVIVVEEEEGEAEAGVERDEVVVGVEAAALDGRSARYERDFLIQLLHK